MIQALPETIGMMAGPPIVVGCAMRQKLKANDRAGAIDVSLLHQPTRTQNRHAGATASAGRETVDLAGTDNHSVWDLKFISLAPERPGGSLRRKLRKPPSLAMKRDCSHKGFARRQRNSADNHVTDLIFQCKYFTKNGNRAMLFSIAGANYGLAWRLQLAGRKTGKCAL